MITEERPKIEKRVTLRDVAAEANVSKTTVAFILNDRPNFAVPETTRMRVRDAAERLGYKRNGLATALARGRTGSIGLIIPSDSPLTNATVSDEYLLSILFGATHAAAEAGLRLTAIAFDASKPPTIDEMTDQRVDGLILVSVLDEGFARGIYATGFPCVTLGSGYAERRITVDNVGGARTAVEYLIELGHRRIAYFGKPDTSEANTERHQGLADALASHDLPIGTFFTSGDELLESLTTDTDARPTAVFCHSDALAAYAMKRLRRCGLSVPEDVSVIGFNDNIVADALDLTTIRSPLARQAAVAVDILTRLIEGEDPEMPDLLPTQLVVRGTTAAPPLPATKP